MAAASTNLPAKMAKRAKGTGDKNQIRAEEMAGVNILTDLSHGVYVKGAEETIEMWERGDLTQQELYSQIMDLEVVYEPKPENGESLEE